MKKKLSLLLSTISLVALVFVITSFSTDDTEKTYWYTSTDIKGYISIQKVDTESEDGKISTIINTVVVAKFEKKPIFFNLSTACDGNKMVSPNKLTFNGLMDISIEPVNFVGKVLNKDEKGSYWNFEGDFIKDMASDPEAAKFIDSDFNAMIRMPARTIPFFNLWAIVPNLPLNKEGTFKFNILDETKLYVRKNQTVNYLGEHNISVDGKEMSLHKFVQQGKGMGTIYYWVNDAKILVQVTLDDKFTFTLTTKENALKNN